MVLVVALAVQVAVGGPTVRVLVGVFTTVNVRVAIGNVAVRVGAMVVATRVMVRVEVDVPVAKEVVPAGKVCVMVLVAGVEDELGVVPVLVPVPVRKIVEAPEGIASRVVVKVRFCPFSSACGRKGVEVSLGFKA